MHIKTETIGEFIIGTLLLSEKFVASLSVYDDGSAFVVGIMMSKDGSKNKSLGTKISISGKNIEITLRHSDLEYIRYYLLKAFRDGASSVDHIDTDSTDDAYTLTIYAPRALTPLTRDQALKRLGINNQ